jgi:predicted XRE-type DNA-binding protein
MTSDEKIEITRGSGNIYRDFGYPDADVRQAKVLVAAQIIKILRTRKLTNREAERITGVSHSEFSRIKKPDLQRFTLDRLMTIAAKLAPEIDINLKIRFRPKRRDAKEQASVSL